MIKSISFTLLIGFSNMVAQAAEERISSPDEKVTVVLSDTGGLGYRVEMDGKALLEKSVLGLEFQDGTQLGPEAVISKTTAARHDSTWENRFGKRRKVVDRYKELTLTLNDKGRVFGLIVRAYDNGVAFRYDLPLESELGNFTLTRELTSFHFAGDFRCWAGGESPSAETQYPEQILSGIPSKGGKSKDRPYLGTLPLLVEAPGAYAAIAESDLLDWAGMFLTGTGSENITVSLAQRTDGKGSVDSSVPRVSPWRVILLGRQAGDLINSDLVATLSTPNKLGDVSWVQPGIAAWDAWWTGVNPHLPQFTGLDTRGDTRSHFEYIDFASEMGWPYQVVDWFWYDKDPTKPLPHVDIPAVFTHARKKNVRLFIWIHSKDLTAHGFEKVFSQMSAWGAVGVKVDFMDSDSQETVKWYADALEAAAAHKLMVDFHGAYKPTGLSRTYPNFITQEGVLGNEYNKLGKKCSPSHVATLPFTRGLLGPMDYTPGGFLNRTPQDFKVASPAQVMGTRAHELALPVIFESPLLVLCDSPGNYRAQPGLEFFRGLPTVWDDTVVLHAEVGKSVAIARRSGDRWYLAAICAEQAQEFRIPLIFLGKGKWSLRSFSDKPGGAATEVVESSSEVTSESIQTLKLSSLGGYAADFRLIK